MAAGAPLLAVATAAGTRQLDGTVVRVRGQVTSRRSAARALLYLDVRAAVGAEQPLESSEEEDKPQSLLQVRVHAEQTGAALLEALNGRQGERRLRLGDYVECAGALAEYGNRPGAPVGLVATGEAGVRVLERFEDRHPGQHFAVHAIAPWRCRANPAPAGSMLDASPLASVLTCPPPDSDGPAPDIRDVSALCKFWLSSGRCENRGCRAVHGTAEQLGAARAAVASHRRQSRQRAARREGDPFGAGEKRSKKQRAEVFADWLVAKFGLERLRSPNSPPTSLLLRAQSDGPGLWCRWVGRRGRGRRARLSELRALPEARDSVHCGRPSPGGRRDGDAADSFAGTMGQGERGRGDDGAQEICGAAHALALGWR